MSKIKICGLKRSEDIQYVNELMPDFIGFVFANTKRKVTIAQAQELKSGLNPAIKAVGVFVNEDVNNVANIANEGIIDIIQLHGDEDARYISNLRRLTKSRIIKAVRVKDKETVEKSAEYNADYILLDTYVKKDVYGGTGKSFDRRLIPENIGKFFLAGGLNAHNLRQAIEECNPYAVDLSSGVETDGIKDKKKIKEVISIVRNVSN